MNDELADAADTPTMIGIRVEESQYKAIRIHCVEEDIEMTDFFAEAFRRFVERREAAAEEGEEFIYRAPPKESRKVSTKGGDQQALAELRAWAERDNKRYSAAYYTAVYEYLQVVRR